MTPAAQVRRTFTSGRPTKAESLNRIHPADVWQRANDLLNDLRARMVAAKLKPEQVHGMLVYITKDQPFKPEHIPVAPEYMEKVFEIFSRSDVYALGVVFRQDDEEAGKRAHFVRQIQPLPEEGMAVLKMGAVLVRDAMGLLDQPKN
jgi:hypothetical protein